MPFHIVSKSSTNLIKKLPKSTSAKSLKEYSYELKKEEENCKRVERTCTGDPTKLDNVLAVLNNSKTHGLYNIEVNFCQVCQFNILPHFFQCMQFLFVDFI